MRKLVLLILGLCVFNAGFAADQRPNPRGGATSKTAAAAQNLTSRNTREAEDKEQAAENTRSNRATMNRVVMTNNRVGAKAVSARSISDQPVAVSRAAVAGRNNIRPMIGGKATAKSSVAARSAVRAATIGAIAAGKAIPGSPSRARAAVGGPQTARATAIFTNMSAMGSDYNSCREAYFACMDQFCGLKSDVYRRCLCSDKFRGFRDREEAFDAAKQMILTFNDNNLNAIGLSADEVGAMNSASEGETALRADNSASAQMLANINDLLSGAKKAADVPTAATQTATRTLNLDSLSGAAGDIWGGGGDVFGDTSSNMFGNQRSEQTVDIESLEGKALYDEVHKQCMAATTACQQNQATGNMVSSAYTVLISQDCSAYEKGLDGQKAALESTIREANNAMQDARLEEYRSHNSASVNECIALVNTAMKDQYACGPNWERCLDFTGLYINSNTGEPIYSAQLFNLKSTINLNNENDQANATFLTNLDNLRNRARSALDTCRDDQETVWSEFKRQALIEIAQAQDEKIEEVKDSCIATMKECYDKQTGAMNSFGAVAGDAAATTMVQTSTGALSQRAAKAMCEEKVLVCAALYGDPAGCSVNPDTGAVGDSTEGKCGLQALLAFVNTVDDTKITMSCKKDLEQYMADRCTPGTTPATAGTTTALAAAAKGCVPQDEDNTSGVCTLEEEAVYEALMISQSVERLKESYPYGCKDMPLRGKGSIYELLLARAETLCTDPDAPTTGTIGDRLDESQRQAIRDIMVNLERSMGIVMQKVCEESSSGDGVWINNWDSGPVTIDATWMANIFGEREAYLKTVPSGVTVTFGDQSNAASAPAGSPGQVAAGTNAGIISSDDGTAIGWGVCRIATDKLYCEWINDAVGTNVATYDAASRLCNYQPNYSKSVCERVLNGVWDANANSCKYVPK